MALANKKTARRRSLCSAYRGRWSGYPANRRALLAH